MSVGRALSQHLADNSNVSALVGTRVYFEQADEDANGTDCVIVQTVTGSHTIHLGGYSGLRMDMYQVRGRSRSPATAETITETCRLALASLFDGGTMGSGSFTAATRGVHPGNVYRVNTFIDDGSQNQDFDVVHEFEITTTEATSE